MEEGRSVHWHPICLGDVAKESGIASLTKFAFLALHGIAGLTHEQKCRELLVSHRAPNQTNVLPPSA